MASRLKDNPRLKCDFCGYYATADCDCWDRKLSRVCGAKVCHEHRHQVYDTDRCPKHRGAAAKPQAKQRPIQTSLFDSELFV